MTIEIKEKEVRDRYLLEELLQRKIEDKNYLAAIKLAQALKQEEGHVRKLQEMALKQMALEYRNGVAVRNLAGEWGFSRMEVERLLRAGLEEYEAASDKKKLDPAYDTATGKYLTLREWVEQFLGSRMK